MGWINKPPPVRSAGWINKPPLGRGYLEREFGKRVVIIKPPTFMTSAEARDCVIVKIFGWGWGVYYCDPFLNLIIAT